MNATVQDVMSTRVIAVRENASFKEIATRMPESFARQRGTARRHHTTGSFDPEDRVPPGAC